MLAICIMASINAQTVSTPNKQKLTQFSLRGGVDNATKSNFSSYVNGKLKGFNLGASVDKYWDWYGLGLDIDFMKNKKPLLNDTLGLNALIFASGFTKSQYASTVSNQTDLTRIFIGLGPSAKLQTKNNKFVAELNLRGGITVTKGSSIQHGTSCIDPLIPLAIANDVNRNGDATGLPTTYGTFFHKAYDNKILGTIKGQVRLNYYVTNKVAINLSSYYMYYFGSGSLYNYLDWKQGFATSTPYKSTGPTFALTKLSSIGFNIGVSVGMFANNINTKAKSIKNNIAILVKDELTGQPIKNVIVTIAGDAGKLYTANTDATGMANIKNIPVGAYSVNGTANEIPTNTQTLNIVNGEKNITVTLVHNDPRFTVVGKAVNLNSKKGESDVAVTLKNQSKGSVKMATSQAGTGEFSFQIDNSTDYELVGKKASYISNIEKISTKGLTRSQTLYVELELGVEEVVKGKSILLNKIYYDIDKANITEDASTDLAKLTQFLTDNPSFKIEVDSHTDSRGTDEYNLKLSQQRAESVISFLTKKGINPANLIAKGFGESKLVNACVNGANCTEEQHQQNRRTEFKLISE